MSTKRTPQAGPVANGPTESTPSIIVGNNTHRCYWLHYVDTALRLCFIALLLAVIVVILSPTGSIKIGKLKFEIALDKNNVCQKNSPSRTCWRW